MVLRSQHMTWLILSLGAYVALGQHYTSSCAGDEVAGEIMGERGVICAPRCRDAGTDSCPADVPSGSVARPQCVLQDVDRNLFCALACSWDSECVSGAYCHRLASEEPGSPTVGICMHQLSFSDWARQNQRVKLHLAGRAPPQGMPAMSPASFAITQTSPNAPPVGPPGSATSSLQVAKGFAALQSLKKRFGIQDGDQDILAMRELLSAAAVRSGGGAAPAAGAPGMAPPAGQMPSISSFGLGAAPPAVPAPAPVLAASPPVPQRRPGAFDAWEHDFGYFTSNVRHGLPGIEKELEDTVWNIEHLQEYGVCTTLLRGIIWIAVIYLAVGMTYKYQAMGARGLDMVPHIGFWREYPDLVADGIRYTIMMFNEFVGSSGGGSSRGGFKRFEGDRDTFASFEPSK